MFLCFIYTTISYMIDVVVNDISLHLIQNFQSAQWVSILQFWNSMLRIVSGLIMSSPFLSSNPKWQTCSALCTCSRSNLDREKFQRKMDPARLISDAFSVTLSTWSQQCRRGPSSINNLLELNLFPFWILYRLHFSLANTSFSQRRMKLRCISAPSHEDQ